MTDGCFLPVHICATVQQIKVLITESQETLRWIMFNCQCLRKKTLNFGNRTSMIQFRIMAKCGSDTIILMWMNKLVPRVIESVERYCISGLEQLLSDCLLFVIRNEIFDYLIFKSYRQYFSHISAGGGIKWERGSVDVLAKWKVLLHGESITVIKLLINKVRHGLSWTTNCMQLLWSNHLIKSKIITKVL